MSTWSSILTQKTLHSRRVILKAIGATGLLASASLLVACEGAPVPVPSDDDAKDIAVTVYVGDNFYEPNEVTVAPGQAVRWEWVGKERHDVVSKDRSFVTELQREGAYVHIFSDAGDYPYLCSIHPEMRGTVTVQ